MTLEHQYHAEKRPSIFIYNNLLNLFNYLVQVQPIFDHVSKVHAVKDLHDIPRRFSPNRANRRCLQNIGPIQVQKNTPNHYHLTAVVLPTGVHIFQEDLLVRILSSKRYNAALYMFLDQIWKFKHKAFKFNVMSTKQ